MVEGRELLLPTKKRKLPLSREEESAKKVARWQLDVEKTRKKKPGNRKRQYQKFAATSSAPCRATLLRLAFHRPVCLFEKTLFRSDVDREQNRLQLKEGEVETSPLMGMLTEEEEAVMKNPKIGLPVTVLDPLEREYRMTLKKLGTRYYRFMGEYNKFVKDNEVKIGDILDIWGFRFRGGQQKGELRFAMLNYGQEDIDEQGEEPTVHENEAAEALLVLKKMPVIFQH